MNANIDYLGILELLRQLEEQGVILFLNKNKIKSTSVQ